MEKFEKSFIEWWKSLTPSEKDKAAIALSRECNTALATIQSWGLGYRTPKARSQSIIAKYLKADTKTLFP
jgi:hypothetical protein